MSHRPHAYALVTVPTHRGNPPNTYVPQITAEIRLYWTPTTTRTEILEALGAANVEILAKLVDSEDTYGHKILEVGVDIDSVGLPLREGRDR